MGDNHSLRFFINCLDQRSLPRILQICSGVYFQGSIYELSGSEVCLSTGDLVKVIGLELLSVSCEEIDSGASFELPTGYSGHFSLVAEDLPYNTIEEIVGLCPVGVDACGSFSFVCQNELTIDNFTLPAGRRLTLLSVEVDRNGERLARCQVLGHNMASAEILLPLHLKGEFYECQSAQGYSLQEIMSSSRLSCRRFCSTTETNRGSSLVFSPVYEISAIMHMRKNIVKFPSSLEVDVQDVTEQYKDLVFITPFSITEVASQPAESFPTVAEILDGPEGNQFFNCSWFQELQKGKQLLLHACGKTKMTLASTPKGRKGKQYFFISEQYGGRMRRRAREFESVYELYLAWSQSPGLKVSVTRHCEAVEEEGIPALSVGEQLEVLEMVQMEKSGAAQKVECLICKRTTEVADDEDDEDEDDEEDEDSEEISLPLFMTGHFVEKLSDNKKYKLTDLMSISLPLDVKVVTRDKDLEKDPLMGLAALKLEESFTESTVLTSLPHKPDWCFELPVRWLQMTLCFTSDHLPPEYQDRHVETVTEVTEKFYYEYHKLERKSEEPPPRPPKRKPSTSEAKKSSKSKSKSKSTSSVTKQLDGLSLGQATCKRAPAPPPPPPEDTLSQPPPLLPRKSSSVAESISAQNTYVKSPMVAHISARTLSDSDHDYEFMEETLNPPHESWFY